jgi:membrane fusion protein
VREGDIATDKVTGGLAPGGAFPPPPPRDFGGGGGGEPSPSSPLFRPEALAAHTELRWGRPIGLIPLSWKIVSVFLAVLIVAVGVFLTTATYARKETVRGILKPVGGEARVLATQGGVLRALYVAEGALVERGTPLAKITRETLLSDGAIADEQVLEGLRQEEATLRDRLRALAGAAPLDAVSMASSVAVLESDRAAALESARLGDARLAIATQRVTSARPLVASGLIAAEELRRREEAELALRQEIAAARGRARSLEAQIRELGARRSRLPFDQAQQRSQLEAALASLSQRRAQAEAARGYELRAQVSGRVSGVQVALGQSLDPSRPLMTLTPSGARLTAEVYVPSRAIGFIRAGQKVRLLYDAFPYQRFGAAQGTVEAVSATVLLPQEVNAALRSEEFREPVYRVTVRLVRQDMLAFGQVMDLSAGMALTADIILEHRSFAEWLFEPILAIRGRL